AHRGKLHHDRLGRPLPTALARPVGLGPAVTGERGEGERSQQRTEEDTGQRGHHAYHLQPSIGSVVAGASGRSRDGTRDKQGNQWREPDRVKNFPWRHLTLARAARNTDGSVLAPGQSYGPSPRR